MENVTEVASIGDRVVLDKAEQVGPRRGERTASVVITYTGELPNECLRYGAQFAVKVSLDEVSDHGSETAMRVRTGSAECPI